MRLRLSLFSYALISGCIPQTLAFCIIVLLHPFASGIVCAQGSSWFQDSEPPLTHGVAVVRQPEPDAASKTKAMALVKEVYADKLRDQAASSRSELASQMIELGVGTTNDPAGRFVLFQTARELATVAGDLNGALRAIRATATYFEIDALVADKDVLAEFAKNSKTPSQRDAVVLSGMDLIDAVIQSKRADIAQELLEILEPVATRSSDASILQSFRAKASLIQQISQTATDEASIVDSLKANPDDPDRNLAAGRFFCAKKQDWARGLPLLAKGSDTSIKKAAELDLSVQTGRGSAIEVADAWREVHATIPSGMERATADRAAYWYATAIPNLTGLQKALAQKRLDELRAGSSQSSQIAPALTASTQQLQGIGPRVIQPKNIVFICDASGSMMSVFWRVKQELRKGIEELNPAQAFNVIFFADVNVIALSKTNLLAATPENKKTAYDLTDRISAGGTTDPLPAIRMAFRHKPDSIYILTDGFDQIVSFDAVVNEFRRLNPGKKVKVNTILIRSRTDPDLEKVLRIIAADSDGTFRIIDRKDM